MRYFVGMAQMKWSHKDRLEQLWIQRELGDELFNEINRGYCKIKILRSDSHIAGYKRCDVYVDIEDDKRAIWFGLKFPQAIHTRKGGANDNVDRLLNTPSRDKLETSGGLRQSNRTYGQRFVSAWRHIFSR